MGTTTSLNCGRSAKDLMLKLTWNKGWEINLNNFNVYIYMIRLWHELRLLLLLLFGNHGPDIFWDWLVSVSVSRVWFCGQKNSTLPTKDLTCHAPPFFTWFPKSPCRKVPKPLCNDWTAKGQVDKWPQARKAQGLLQPRIGVHIRSPKAEAQSKLKLKKEQHVLNVELPGLAGEPHVSILLKKHKTYWPNICKSQLSKKKCNVLNVVCFPRAEGL